MVKQGCGFKNLNKIFKNQPERQKRLRQDLDVSMAHVQAVDAMQLSRLGKYDWHRLLNLHQIQETLDGQVMV